MIEFTGLTRYYKFIDNMQVDIVEAVENCFDKEADPEVSWSVFRDYLRRIKKQHKEEYGLYLESDMEEDLPESEMARWRRENPNK